MGPGGGSQVGCDGEQMDDRDVLVSFSLVAVMKAPKHSAPCVRELRELRLRDLRRHCSERSRQLCQ